jgi:DMSO/TMAO reductase YedYZ molybdopterin-dependent catalytic subunit
MNRNRPLLTGLGAGTLGVAVDWLVHAVIGIPLIPEQAGVVLIKLLPLGAFAGLLKTFGILARPLLLVGATIVIIAVYGAAAFLAARLSPRGWLLVLTGVTALVTAILGIMAYSPGDSVVGLIAEIVILAGMIPLVDSSVGRITSGAAVDEDRRLILRNLLYGSVIVAVLGIGYGTVRRFANALAMREGSRADTEVTAVSDFYVVSKNIGGDPVVDGSSWRLNLPTRSLNYSQLLALPSHRVELTLECISNDIGGTLISNGVWTGPSVSDVLGLTTVPSDAVWMLLESTDGYTESFPLRELTPDHLLATHLNGAPLPPQHGFPARFIFPGHYGMKQPKWVTRISFSVTDQPGFWENNGWNEQAIVKTMSRIDRPADGAALPAGSVEFAGIAYSGDRRISAVDLTLDGGTTWRPTVLQAEFSPYAWRFWQLTVSLAAGHYDVRVRARDGDGTLQTSAPAPTLPDGADGYHSISVDVA